LSLETTFCDEYHFFKRFNKLFDLFDCTNKCMFEFQSIYSCAGGIGYRSGAHEFTPVYNGVRVA
jgi:hypothetical protein